MLDINFYSENGLNPVTIDVSENFYLWLSGSEFSTIGVSCPHTVKIDTDEISLKVVDLNKENMSYRQRYRKFLVESIVKEVDIMLMQIGNAPPLHELQDTTYKLNKLQKLRKCVENEDYRYLEKF